MNRLHILGRKNHGKTTLLVALVEELTRHGLKVGAIKHTHHSHELDTPGKDSHRHRMAGAAVVGILSRDLTAIYQPVRRETAADPYAPFAASMDDCDLVLVEGDTQATAPKIEVWRAEIGGVPLAKSDESILAVVSDDHVDCSQPIWPRSDISTLADQVQSLLSP